MTATDDLAPLIEILAARIRRQVEEKRTSDRVAVRGLELHAALRRYGASGPSVAEAVRLDDAARLDPAERDGVVERVEREIGRQARFSRSRDPRYDINRHIVVTRLRRWLDGKAAWLQEPPAAATKKPAGRGKTRRRKGASADAGHRGALPQRRPPRRHATKV
ncbi:hypothetical protein [Aurantimonas sp. 22II-16-19i]|uniref:hypothetical protein n=1 Tax=Aurantimonas sp. 22II-16-19i TaxID=1317114 RepID=UPI0009F7EB5B|nr:hypothetical protein [Aurantimonas sp. 22II-16-19i]ORE98381.1 hypothetical protein ATO4_02665 [Aurantimonas sp. 22II-16-19i]